MKTCLICQAECPASAVACHACGEGSFAPSDRQVAPIQAEAPVKEGGEVTTSRRQTGKSRR